MPNKSLGFMQGFVPQLNQATNTIASMLLQKAEDERKRRLEDEQTARILQKQKDYFDYTNNLEEQKKQREEQQQAGFLNTLLNLNTNPDIQSEIPKDWQPTKLSSVDEQKFQDYVKNSDWFNQFTKENPDADPNELFNEVVNNKDYDYRKAYLNNITPQPNPYDNNRLHWASKTDNGEWLKSPNHPTTWKEIFMEKTGKDPDSIGVKNINDANKYLKQSTQGFVAELLSKVNSQTYQRYKDIKEQNTPEYVYDKKAKNIFSKDRNTGALTDTGKPNPLYEPPDEPIKSFSQFVDAETIKGLGNEFKGQKVLKTVKTKNGAVVGVDYNQPFSIDVNHESGFKVLSPEAQKILAEMDKQNIQDDANLEVARQNKGVMIPKRKTTEVANEDGTKSYQEGIYYSPYTYKELKDERIEKKKKNIETLKSFISPKGKSLYDETYNKYKNSWWGNTGNLKDGYSMYNENNQAYDELSSKVKTAYRNGILSPADFALYGRLIKEEFGMPLNIGE